MSTKDTPSVDSSEEDIPLSKIIKRRKSKGVDSDEDFTIRRRRSTPRKKANIKETKKPKAKTKNSVESDDDIPLSSLTKNKMNNKNESTNAKTKEDKGEQSENDNGGENNEYKWWEGDFDDSIKWTTLEHSGVLFPPEYEPHGVPLKYDGEMVKLNAEEEEIAGFYAHMLETDYVKNPIFNKNFFDGFRSVLTSENKKRILKLEKCDFTLMYEYFQKLRDEKKNMTKEEKEKIKQEKLKMEEKYMTASIDGRIEKVGNFRIEPPGLFRGRGKHPKAGCIKKRIRPEDVTINIGKTCKIPDPPAGHSWRDIIHNNQVTWLATWEDTVNMTPKYVFLAAGSSLKGQSDFKKFEKARELKDYVLDIRRKNTEELRDSDLLTRQRATALWLIDKLALRAGNEKGEDEADTVGCCSLRCEHIELAENNTVIFDFLGKDSIRYYNQVEVDKIIHKNLKEFKKGKKKDEPLFNLLTTASLNKYLTSLMPGLTAKVFRTFNASFTFQEELKNTPSDGTVAEKILAYNRANRQVAILCNHQRSIPKSHDTSMTKLKEKILMLKYEKYLLRLELLDLVEEKTFKNRPEITEMESDLDDDVIARKKIEKEELELKKIEQKKIKLEQTKSESQESKKVDVEKDSNSDEESSPKRKKKDLEEPRKKTKLSPERLEKKILTLKNRIENMKLALTDRDENKTTALSTSKTNYIDPRISFAWSKLHSVPIEKLFNKGLRDKFKWATSVDANWSF
ncbi:hypothetical protein ROZALSC1DRAFT_27488 [Rozella allomycis CSF55]|uniref:DNA topoisomerase I n=1 Tax=Rozella allomycis (strain CSF55) TaxID=988480 RepID=A0A075AMX5_ROZAC|nr:DNA topoisomerase I, catalytic core, alpha/beta sub domain-containing protein [Rozella allomycis CSF55]RKP21065.1 hypothetical protein ROZALSC1DRAFT_27488 [Rozella allomycis CSF55]|eukprot:EPZ31074.1 DNA topoisomerase I, catalytic core, alpha/beta sub domain-containing protein [Rozella allomycis CSF55]